MEHSQLFLLALEAFLPSGADCSTVGRDYRLGCPSTIWASTSGTGRLVITRSAIPGLGVPTLNILYHIAVLASAPDLLFIVIYTIIN